MRLPACLHASLFLLAFSTSPGTHAAAGNHAASGDHAAPIEGDLPAAVATALQGVVSLTVREVERIPTFHNGRFQIEVVEGVGAGSGVIVSRDGLTLTNAHVVSGSTEVQVRFASGREAVARVLAVDEASDLALVKIAGAGFPWIPLAREQLPAAGTGVFLAGNRDGDGPAIYRARLGPHRRVRAGARPIEFWSEIIAPVGPGDSGGAILSDEGELLGIPSLQVHYAKVEGSPPTPHTAGLFIPVSHIRRALHRLRAGERVVWPWLGLLLEDPLMTASEGKAWSGNGGARVRQVLRGGPAEEAGFEPGDRLVAIGPRRVGDIFEALDAVLDLPLGMGVPVRIERNGRMLVVAVVTGPRPADPRPDPLDDFRLHTGLRLESRPGRREGRDTIAVASMTNEARERMPSFEARLFAENPVLGSILPGRDLLDGRKKRLSVLSIENLATILSRCFVKDQFVAIVHWSLGATRSVDRAHVHRKIYPAVI